MNGSVHPSRDPADRPRWMQIVRSAGVLCLSIRAKVMVAAAAGEKKPAWPAFNAAVASGACASTQ